MKRQPHLISLTAILLLLCVVFGERAMAQSLSLEGRSASWKPVAGEKLLIFAKIDDPKHMLLNAKRR